MRCFRAAADGGGGIPPTAEIGKPGKMPAVFWALFYGRKPGRKAIGPGDVRGAPTADSSGVPSVLSVRSGGVGGGDFCAGGPEEKYTDKRGISE